VKAKGEIPQQGGEPLIKETTEAIGFPRGRELQIRRRSSLETAGIGATALPGWSPRGLRGR
jgi:hypothetical protein